jgi:hypothetical protein
MPTDNEAITNAYLDILEEANNVDLKRLSDTEIEIDGVKKDITDFLYEISNGGAEIITVWARRRRDKKVGGQIIARAGEEFTANGRLGACAKEITGAGSPMGGPKERYSTYGLFTMCVRRESEFHTRHIGTAEVTKVKSGFTTYNFI